MDTKETLKITEKTKIFTDYAKMMIKTSKCAHLYNRWSRSNWYKGPKDSTKVRVREKAI